MPILTYVLYFSSYNVTHIYTYAGSVMGIVGYGDIGVACAKLAKAFGMRVVTLRRRPELNGGDPYVGYVRLYTV